MNAPVFLSEPELLLVDGEGIAPAVFLESERPIDAGRSEVFVVTTGEQGPPGAGASDEYSETFASATSWTINHNLGRYPSITLRTLGGAEIIAEILHVSVNQAIAYFAQSTAGVARCI